MYILFLLSEKISADEFFKATGIRVNEPVSTIKTNEEYLNPSDHIYSSTKAIHTTNLIDNGLSLDIDNENSNNFSIESLSYQDLINSLPVSLISAPSTESSLETSDLPFIISDKNLDIGKLPETILEDVASPINSMSNTFELLEVMTQTDCNSLKDKSEESTQTDNDLVKNNLFNTIQTESIFISNNLEECTQTEFNFEKNFSEETTQTETSFLKDKLASKRKLKRILHNKKQELRDWKMKTEQNFGSIMDNVTLEQYELLTEKFFPKETSEFIKIQAKLFKKKTNDRKYSLGFKKQCLSLFLAGPKTYKNLQKIFCLPGERDLQTLKF